MYQQDDETRKSSKMFMDTLDILTKRKNVYAVFLLQIKYYKSHLNNSQGTKAKGHFEEQSLEEQCHLNTLYIRNIELGICLYCNLVQTPQGSS